MPARRFVKYFYMAGGAILLLVLWFNIARPVVVLPRMRLAPGYAMQNALGETVTSEDQRGGLTLYSFAYTRCASRCQHVYTVLREVDGALALQPPAVPVRLITVTVDPEVDTVDRLLAFQLPFAPQAARWDWLTAEPGRAKSVLSSGFEIFSQPQADGSVAYNPRFVLVDGWGTIRSEYDAVSATSQTLLRDIRLVLDEVEKAKGAARLAYEAAHFFACYP
jgi:protein SCO1/2